MRQRYAFCIALAAVFLSVALALAAHCQEKSGVHAQEWIFETVDPEDGRFNSLALDSLGQPHICYFDYVDVESTVASLRYATKSGSEWITQTITTGVGIDGPLTDTSLDVDSWGSPHIAFYRWETEYDPQMGGNLEYAWHDGTLWHIETADHGAYKVSVGAFASLALSSDDQPHVSYVEWSALDNTSSLRYAYFDNTEWITETLETSESWPYYATSLALDSSDQPHIAYIVHNPDALMYTWREAELWHTDVVTSGTDLGGSHGELSLALDQSDRPHIAFLSSDYDDDDHQLVHTWNDGQQWLSEAVDPIQATYISLAIDSAGQCHIAYHDWSGGDSYAHQGASGWEVETLDTMSYGYTSLALDRWDLPHISYVHNADWEDRILAYAYVEPSFSTYLPLVLREAE